jgi:KipI family sensor histidine kinase inhibitor
MLLLYDPLRTTAVEIETYVVGLKLPAADPHSESRQIEIPVLYGGEMGVDLGRVAALAGISEEEVVELHAQTEYIVRFLGFMPGFPYLGPLPVRLATPRHETPRTVVPAGSVAIAEDQTSIYPVASPGGWNLIGRTPCRLFDPREDPPSMLLPGDRVRFRPVDEAEYSRIHFEILAGRR